MKIKMRFTKLVALCGCLLGATAAQAVTNVFFNGSQTATVTASNITAVTINSEGYLFTYSQDGYWSAYPGGPPTGRFFSVFWPTGVQAQAITVQPTPPVASGANITIKRADGKLFDLWSFTGKLLANTAGAGGAFEIMPQLNGNDAFNDPLMFDATGYAGQSFSHTPMLSGYDTYTIHLWVDWALTALTLIDTNPVVPVSTITNTIAASVSPVGAGTVGGAGDYPSNTVATLTASPNLGWNFLKWTENSAQVSTSPAYTFTVRSNRTLVANFIPSYTVTTGTSPTYGGTATGAGAFNSNATVTVQAAANSGFQFVNWTDYGTPVSTATNYTFAIAADHSFVANFAPLPQTAIFDFDTGWPVVGPTQGMPSTQSNLNVTATFSTLSGGWSVQNTFYGWVPGVFSGNFLYPSTWGSTMAIEFDHPITDFFTAFATGDVSSEYNIPTIVRVTAYTNSAMTNPIGSVTAQGAWLTGAYPEGMMSFHSATPFTKVKLDMPGQNPPGSYILFVDNIVVQRAAAPTNFNVTTASSPANGGTTTGDGSYALGSNATVHATANAGFVFLDWLNVNTGLPASTNASYTFTSASDVSLIAEFLARYNVTTVASPLAGGTVTPGGTFNDGSLVTFTATTNAGYVFLDWLEGGVPISYTPVFDYYVYTNATLTAEFLANSPPACQVKSITSITASSATVNFAGTPGYAYVLQRTTNFANWVNLSTNVMPTNGVFSVQDNFSDLGNRAPGAAFYRLQAQ